MTAPARSVGPEFGPADPPTGRCATGAPIVEGTAGDVEPGRATARAAWVIRPTRIDASWVRVGRDGRWECSSLVVTGPSYWTPSGAPRLASPPWPAGRRLQVVERVGYRGPGALGPAGHRPGHGLLATLADAPGWARYWVETHHPDRLAAAALARAGEPDTAGLARRLEPGGGIVS